MGKKHTSKNTFTLSNKDGKERLREAKTVSILFLLRAVTHKCKFFLRPLVSVPWPQWERDRIGPGLCIFLARHESQDSLKGQDSHEWSLESRGATEGERGGPTLPEHTI